MYAQAVKGSVTTNARQQYDGGLLRDSWDEYGVVTSYTYDSYGNLTQTKVSATGTSESIITSSTYESNEFLKTTTGNQVTTVYDQRSPYGNFESVTDGNGLKTKFTYNAFGDAAKEINFLTGMTEHSKHTLDYDAQGSLQKLTHDSSGWNYEIAESNYGKTVKEKINGQEVISRTVSQYGDTVITVYGNAFTVVDTYDKYGRLWVSSSSDSSGFVSSITNTYYDYNNTGSNTSAAKLRKTVEKRDETEYTKEYTYLYSYDTDEQQLLGFTYIAKIVGGAEVLNNTVVRDEDDPAKYYQNFNSVLKTVYLVNDPDKLIAPRRTSVITQLASDDSLNTNYTYDFLGRIKTVTQTGFAWTSSLVTTYIYI